MTNTLPPRVRRRLRLSAIALYWERLWPRLWPAAAILGTFVAFVLLDILPRLPALAHLVLLVAFAAALAYALLRALPYLRPAEPNAVRRRLDAAMAGERPIAALEDRLAAGADDAFASALWHRHKQRMAAKAETLPVPWPAPGVARYEPWGIRAGVVLLLLIAVTAGGQSWQERLARAIRPPIGFGSAGTTAEAEVWITPPSYTARPPVFLRSDPSARSSDRPPSHIPTGSTALVRVTGLASTPSLRIGGNAVAFIDMSRDQGAPSAYRAETVITAGDRLAIRVGSREVAGWPILVVPDRPPAVAAATVTDNKGSGLLDLGYEASDDYGVNKLIARLSSKAAGSAAMDEDGPRLPITLGEPGAPVAVGRALLDLAAHPWAGQPATLVLEASDVIGQSAAGPPTDIILPERSFSHPVARILVAERRRLIDPSPETKASVAAALASVAADPSRFDNDVVVALGLSVARWRLLGDEAVASSAVPTVYNLLWELALRLEDGGIDAAERRLAEARQQLTDALRNGASEADIERMMDALRDALDEYLATLAAELDRRPEAQQMPLSSLGQTLRSDALRSLLDRARELSRTGARNEARALLGDLQRVLDGLRLGLRQGATSERLRAAEKLMQDLRALEARQRALLEETFQRQREQEQRRASRRAATGESQGGIAAQRDLRRDLGGLAQQLQDQLGAISGPLGAADQAMRDAMRALGGDRLSDAVSAQGQAAEALAQALEEARDAIARQLGENSGQFGFGGEGSGDPFGRPAGGPYGFADGTVAIPDRTEIQRIQDLLKELRRRAGERDRPSDELDYIERLLKPF
ncbi:MAG: DUF4175 family protein [Rhodospirillales bacterium]